MQTHLVKCRKSYPDQTKKACPFNATHMIHDLEMEVRFFFLHLAGVFLTFLVLYSNILNCVQIELHWNNINIKLIQQLVNPPEMILNV